MIKITELSKRIKKEEVLNSISYTFNKGNIYGLTGRNGSGKTMLLRAISGLIYPTTGMIEIEGKKLHHEISFPPSIGLTIENTNLLPQFDAFTNLKILAKIKNIASKQDIIKSIDRVGLNPYSTLKVKKFSLGMKQRLSIAQAIFEKPNIILLDEPTNAIDEDGVKLVRNLLLEEKARGATIIIASHHREDVKILADECLHMDNGTIIYQTMNNNKSVLL
ncbi:ATP-binding cassette domain-containing protein [Peribacillus simplex]|uniref:ATP-binding cassette domain-containing protein n=1 Tax=Peribacillus simplex TaxID=1478 RepID=UPI003CF55C13